MRPLVSPWWSKVAEILAPLEGLVVSCEELVALLPDYPGGRRPRAMAAVRRLASCLELVERGPNRSLTRGARYRIIGHNVDALPPPEDGMDESWLNKIFEKAKK